jgi:hypothetical protein
MRRWPHQVFRIEPEVGALVQPDLFVAPLVLDDL